MSTTGPVGRSVRAIAAGLLITASGAGISAVFLGTTPAAFAQSGPETLTKDNVIAGTMDITFNTRLNKDTSGKLKEGSSALGAQDSYKFEIAVADTTQFTGEVTRQPNLFSKIIGKKEQQAQLAYAIDLIVRNPKDLKQSKPIGKWVGLVPIDPNTGAYDLAGGRSADRPLRVKVEAAGKASGFEDFFGGRMMGKAEKKDNLGQQIYKRIIGDRTVQVKVTRSDPMRFEQLILAKGPSENYPKTVVNGRLDYDYETGNFFTDGISFRYTLDGKEYEDVITGSIKWVEDKDRDTNGKGYYEFNLRFNEDKEKTAKSEGAAFEKMSEEDAFFAVDNSVPCLTGRINYVDTFISGSDLPSASKVTYALNANKLSKQQLMNFFKLWMICVGPTNDE